MADTPAPSDSTSASASSSAPPGDATAAIAVRAEFDAAIPTIREALASVRTLVAEIEAIKTRAIISQGALDEHVISAQKGAADLTVQLEAARKHATEISAVTGSANGEVTQTKELVVSASSALDALKSQMTGISSSVATAETLRVQIEKNAKESGDRSKHIENGLAQARRRQVHDHVLGGGGDEVRGRARASPGVRLAQRGSGP